MAKKATKKHKAESPASTCRRTVFIDCDDTSVKKSIEKIAKKCPQSDIKIVTSAKDAEAIVVDTVKKWVHIEKKGWNGSVVLNTHGGEKVSKHKKFEGITYHCILGEYVAIFICLSFDIFELSRLARKKKGKKNKKGKK